MVSEDATGEDIFQMLPTKNAYDLDILSLLTSISVCSYRNPISVTPFAMLFPPLGPIQQGTFKISYCELSSKLLNTSITHMGDINISLVGKIIPDH